MLTANSETIIAELDEAECLRLITPGGIGRIAYAGLSGLTVFPVSYRLVDGAIVFRIAQHSSTGEDLRAGIARADCTVAFEIDDFDDAAREGWSVLVQGSAHCVGSGSEQAAVLAAGVKPWPDSANDHVISVTPTRITGRQIEQG
ncbi:MAG: pyridoxamine 5'-phosphate oxidase family protein [Actinomycetota bacterium]